MIYLWEQLTDVERARVMGEQAAVYGWPFSEEHLRALFWVRDGKKVPRAKETVSVEDVRAGKLYVPTSGRREEDRAPTPAPVVAANASEETKTVAVEDQRIRAAAVAADGSPPAGGGAGPAQTMLPMFTGPSILVPPNPVVVRGLDGGAGLEEDLEARLERCRDRGGDGPW